MHVVPGWTRALSIVFAACAVVVGANCDCGGQPGAAAAPAGGEITGRACGDDDDFYAVDSHPGCDVDARMTQQQDEASVGDVDILLFDPEIGRASCRERV